MMQKVRRRRFLQLGGAALAALSFARPASTAAAALQASKKRKLKKAVHLGMINIPGSIEEKFKLVKDLGFDGVELDSPTGLNRDEIAKALEKTGLEVSDVIDSIHWSQTLSDPSADVRARGVEGLKTALRDAKHWKCGSVLLVPAVVRKEVSYADAYTRSQEEIKKALPLAEELGVKIAIENVWNQFLLSPLEAARYVDELKSPAAGFHFDVGNVVTYGYPEQWIRILGKRIVRLHIKEYSRKKRDKEGPGSGFGVELLEGDCDWPAVMKALDEIGYEGWGTAEIGGGDAKRLKTIAELMDKIYAS
jgi:hexulose-6-phosphate isomerase